jgi:hypothetical protein
VDPARFTRAVITNGASLLFLVQAVLPLLARGSTVFFLPAVAAAWSSPTTPPSASVRRWPKA